MSITVTLNRKYKTTSILKAKLFGLYSDHVKLICTHTKTKTELFAQLLLPCKQQQQQQQQQRTIIIIIIIIIMKCSLQLVTYGNMFIAHKPIGLLFSANNFTHLLILCEKPQQQKPSTTTITKQQQQQTYWPLVQYNQLKEISVYMGSLAQMYSRYPSINIEDVQTSQYMLIRRTLEGFVAATARSRDH